LKSYLSPPLTTGFTTGSNPEYIDKNYGGILIVWDRIFGTFQEEKAQVVFGITKDINSRAFLTSVFHYYQNLIFQAKQLSHVEAKNSIDDQRT
jgi:hypothetical protein